MTVELREEMIKAQTKSKSASSVLSRLSEIRDCRQTHVGDITHVISRPGTMQNLKKLPKRKIKPGLIAREDYARSMKQRSQRIERKWYMNSTRMLRNLTLCSMA